MVVYKNNRSLVGTTLVATSSEEQLKSIGDIVAAAEELSHIADDLRELTTEFKV